MIPGCCAILSVQWPAAVRRLHKCIALTVVGYAANGATGYVGASPLPGNQNKDERPAGTRPQPAGASQASQSPSIPTWGDTVNYVVSSYLWFLLLWGYSSSQPGTSAGMQAKNRAFARPWLSWVTAKHLPSCFLTAMGLEISEARHAPTASPGSGVEGPAGTCFPSAAAPCMS